MSGEFEKRLARYELLEYSARKPAQGEQVVVDMRSVRIVTFEGHPGGLMSALFAVQLVAGVESHRLLHVLYDMLGELLNTSGPDAIALRLAELIQAATAIRKHLEATELAQEEAGREMTALGDAPHQPGKEPVH